MAARQTTGRPASPAPLRLAAAALAAFALAASLATQVQAQMLCSKPLQPLCSLQGQQFADVVAKTRCEEDVRNYAAELEAFRGCLRDSAADAEREVEKARRFLGCLEDSGDDCTLEADPAS